MRALIALFLVLVVSGAVFASDTTPASPPNIMLIVVDDMGYSDLGSFGGEIRTPNIDALADDGVRFTRFYTQPMCAPTRASILTGVDNHQNGLGVMAPLHTKNQYMQPGYEGFLNDKVVTLAEVLGANGYHTYMSGKWHLGFLDESQYPTGRGFEKSFSQMAGGSGYFQDGFALGPFDAPATFYVEDGKRIDALPEDFYSTTAFTDRMIQYIEEAGDDKPLFGYLAYTAPHDPLHVTDDYIDRYKGAYDSGFDGIRKERLQRMKRMGLIDEAVPHNPGSGDFPTWDSLTDEEKRSQSRKMEVYAAMIECVDDEVGRLMDALKEENRFENTLFVFMSDNGPNPYEPAFYYLGDKDALESQGYNNSLENMGRDHSFISTGGAWAEVSATPFSYCKTTTGEGGIRAPLIVSGPGVEIEGIHDVTVHAADIYPTILDFAKVTRPETFKGEALNPLFGRSAKGFLQGDAELVRDTAQDPLCFEISGYKAVYQGDWKLKQGQVFSDSGEWVLINLKDDPTEKTDVSATHPERVREMAQHWEDYSIQHGYIAPEGELYVIEIGPEAFFKFEQK